MSEFKASLGGKGHAPFVPFVTISGANPNAQRIVDLKTQLDLGLRNKDLVVAIREGADLNAGNRKKVYVYKTSELEKVWRVLTGNVSEEQYAAFLGSTAEIVKRALTTDPKSTDSASDVQQLWVAAYTQAGDRPEAEDNHRALIACVGRALAYRTKACGGDLTASAPQFVADLDTYTSGAAAPDTQSQSKKITSALCQPLGSHVNPLRKRLGRRLNRCAVQFKLNARQGAHGGALLGVTVGQHVTEFMRLKMNSRKFNQLESDLEQLNAKVGQPNANTRELNADVRELNADVEELDTEVGELNDAVKQLDAEVGELSGVFGTLRSEVRHLDSEVGELSGGFRRLSGEFKKLSGEFRRLEGVLEELKTMLQQLRAEQVDARRAYGEDMLPNRGPSYTASVDSLSVYSKDTTSDRSELSSTNETPDSSKSNSGQEFLSFFPDL